VDWENDGTRLEAATAGMDNYTFSYPETANHVLKHEERTKAEVMTSTAPNYNEDGTVLDAGALTVIEDWLSEQTRSTER
jgi:hypothetical protein